MLVPYHWAIAACLSCESCGQQGSNPRRRDGSPPSYHWTIPARPGADSGSRTRIDRVGSCHLDRWTMSALRGRPRERAARENRTRHLLHTRQAPRCLGLSSKRGGTGRDRTDHLLTAGQALSRLSYGPTGKSADEQMTMVGGIALQAVTHDLRLVRVERRGVEPRSLPCEGRILPVEISPRKMKYHEASRNRWRLRGESNPHRSIDNRATYRWRTKANTRPAPPRRIELPSLDRQSSCFTRCIRRQARRARRTTRWSDGDSNPDPCCARAVFGL